MNPASERWRAERSIDRRFSYPVTREAPDTSSSFSPSTIRLSGCSLHCERSSNLLPSAGKFDGRVPIGGRNLLPLQFCAALLLICQYQLQLGDPVRVFPAGNDILITDNLTVPDSSLSQRGNLFICKSVTQNALTR